MCVVSMVGDHYGEKFTREYPQLQPYWTTGFTLQPAVTRQEFDTLKAEVAEMVALLRRAKLYSSTTRRTGSRRARPRRRWCSFAGSPS